MRSHLVPHMQDHSNARRIKMLAHKRKRCFEYLKRKDLVRYNQCLMEVGVDKRAVEGELVIHRWWCVCLCSSSPLALPKRRVTLLPGACRQREDAVLCTG